ncbi:rab-GTPase-TBC domain-containing protein [Mycena sp. CBHHK59/15]|nr:rab-GTPase-TBC domain-containing protein [Mycena sp. CBHHK59/15]
MSARPPPARPHIAIHPSTRLPRQSSHRTAPKPVPRPANNASSSTLAFSYTHVSAPNPSSYPPREVLKQNGWTIVKTKSGSPPPPHGSDSVPDNDDARGDADVEGDMILGDLEPEAMEPMDIIPPLNHKPKSDQGLVREDVEDILNDPLCGVRHRSRRTEQSPPRRKRSEKLMRERSIRTNRRHKFVDCLSSQDVNIAELRKLAWAGIPADLRPMAWQLLLGYLPLPTPLRSTTLARKRGEYLSLVELAFARDREGLDQQIWHQIEIDVPRTRPGVRLWMHGATQRSLERILYVWAIRHPASGYVQGINDLVTPFFQVFLSAYIDSDPEAFDPSHLPARVLDAVEADSFWCLSRLLDGIQDNYIFAQPGIQRSVRRMVELVARIDAPLSAHLDKQNVEFMQFAFRWMNCLLMREISVRNTIRMWDTYLAEGPDAFSQFHLYVCSAFLVKWSEKLRQMDFQGIIMFLQSLPTQEWGDHEIEMLLSEAFVLNSIWHNAQSHFTGK